MSVTICRLYESYPDAVQVVEALQLAGVPVQNISLISNNSEGWFDSDKDADSAATDATSADTTSEADATASDQKRRADAPSSNTKSPTNAAASGTKSDTSDDSNSSRLEAGLVGAAIGATAGTAGSLIGSLVALAIPGVGPVVGAGWLLGTMAAAAAVGGTTGGLLGALANAGLSEADAAIYAEGVRRGGSVVTARVSPADTGRAESVMNRGAVDIKERGSDYRQSGWKSFNPTAAPYSAEQVRSERELHRAA
jgi:hypothetical protein